MDLHRNREREPATDAGTPKEEQNELLRGAPGRSQLSAGLLGQKKPKSLLGHQLCPHSRGSTSKHLSACVLPPHPDLSESALPQMDREPFTGSTNTKLHPQKLSLLLLLVP